MSTLECGFLLSSLCRELFSSKYAECQIQEYVPDILLTRHVLTSLQLQKNNDPNISFCPVDHPFIPVAKLEAEGQKLLEALATMLYTSQYVRLLSV